MGAFSIQVTKYGAAIFNCKSDIQTFFSPVTGSNASSVDDLIQIQGNSSLFLLNSQGILIGPNAHLNIGGNFVATTATAIQFSDYREFTTTNPMPIVTSYNASVNAPTN